MNHKEFSKLDSMVEFEAVSHVVAEIATASARGADAAAELAAYYQGGCCDLDGVAAVVAQQWAAGWACWAAHADYNGHGPWSGDQYCTVNPAAFEAKGKKQ